VEGIPDADKSLPIGKPNPNMDILLLDENDQLVEKQGEIGEICARSPSIATGYYNDPERTAEVFVQNPLNKSVREIIFRTGDLAYLDENNDYIYIGRKDNQIKYMGYRIELGEIEANISAVSGVEEAACIYDREAKHIIAYYTGSIMEKELGKILKGKLPEYMLPRKRIRLENMPHNVNGKIDRVSLRKMYSQA
jgi:acyl-coenzyme A synthetase/AMP-(fatty) acid ligase